MYTSLKSTFSGYNFVADNTGPSSFDQLLLPPKHDTRNVAKFEEDLTLQQFKVILGHRSWCQCWFYPPFPCLTLPLGGGHLRFSGWTSPAKTRGMGLPYGENFIITSTVKFSTWCHGVRCQLNHRSCPPLSIFRLRTSDDDAIKRLRCAVVSAMIWQWQSLSPIQFGVSSNNRPCVCDLSKLRTKTRAARSVTAMVWREQTCMLTWLWLLEVSK